MRNLPTKYTIILVITLGVCVAYGWSYVHYRQNKVIVHYYTTGFGHNLEARLPEGPHMFALAIINNFDVDEVLISNIRRVELLNIVYLPLRKMEEFYWSLRPKS